MKIAVEGCAHGELDRIYETMEIIEKKQNVKIDLLLICGDFQAVRNEGDLRSMAVPKKFQKMNTFYKYYSGEKKAPTLTIIIGGNHEASNYMQELPYGGWIAPNIYYLGYASVVQFGGIRIGGLSGIYKTQDFYKGHYECPPYTEETKRSVYHVRNLEFFRMKQISRHIDIMMSHDWPLGIHTYGDLDDLLRKKKFLESDIRNNSLGSPPAADLLHFLCPTYWFSAHLHVKFSAIVPHKDELGELKSETKFLSLDKCLPKRDFLQILDIEHKKPLKLELDAEWLAILKSTNHLLHLKKSNCYMPTPGNNERYVYKVSDEDIESIINDFGGDLTIPENFVQTGSVHTAGGFNNAHYCSSKEILINDQTTLLCDMLGITNPNKDNFKDILPQVDKEESDKIKDISPQVEDKEESDKESKGSIDEEEFREIVSTQPKTPEEFREIVSTQPKTPIALSPSVENSQESNDQNVSSFSSNSSKRSLDSSDLNSSLNSTGKKLKRRNLSIYSDELS